MSHAIDAGATLRRSSTALLTTFRRNGDPVPTPVSIALHAGRVYFVTAADSGKARRLARSDRVTLTSCSVRGVPRGKPVSGVARKVERRRVGRLLRPTGSLFFSYLLYRVRGHRMVVYEVVLTGPGSHGRGEEGG